MQSSAGVNIQYNFPTTNNNGKIASETDVVSGETVTYTYDSLNRLASATSSVNPGWGQAFTYDGFGNLTTAAVTKGTAFPLSVTYDAQTNRRTNDCADANGNIYPCGSAYTYDASNRITVIPTSAPAGGTARYSYGPGNLRVWRGVWTSGGTQTVDELTYYSASGQKLCSYNFSVTGGGSGMLVAAGTGYYEYFGGKLIKNTTGYIGQDRLGSRGKYFPYGQDRSGTPANGSEKFATYTRDSETGLDYAQNRFHSAGDGRFLTPDPYGGSAGPLDPGSWNRYAYVGGDPINRADPSGLYYMFAYQGIEFRDDTVNGLFLQMGCHPSSGDDIDIPGAFWCGPESFVATATQTVGVFMPQMVEWVAPGDGDADAQTAPTVGPNFSSSIDQDRLRALYNRLQYALGQESCSGIFGGPGAMSKLFGLGGVTAGKVLESLIWDKSSKYGSIRFVDGPVPNLQRTDVPAATSSNSMFSSVMGFPTASTITISSLPLDGMFNTASARSAGSLILHEFGHLLYNLGWSTQIRPDGTSESLSNTNMDLIMNNCGQFL